jgi:hypothetical protein
MRCDDVRAVAAQSSAVAPWAREALAAFDAGPLPSLACTLRARGRSGDEVIVTDERGGALLALRRTGVGVAATFASHPLDEWAPAWAAAGDRWRALLGWLARSSREHRERGLELRVDARVGVELVRVPSDVAEPVRVLACDAAGAEMAHAPARVVHHPAFAWGAYRVAEGLPRASNAPYLYAEDARGRRLGWAFDSNRHPPEFARPAARIAWSQPAPAVPAHVRGPRAPAMGWAALAAGIVLASAGGALGAVSKRAWAREVRQVERLSVR